MLRSRARHATRTEVDTRARPPKRPCPSPRRYAGTSQHSRSTGPHSSTHSATPSSWAQLGGTRRGQAGRQPGIPQTRRQLAQRHGAPLRCPRHDKDLRAAARQPAHKRTSSLSSSGASSTTGAGPFAGAPGTCGARPAGLSRPPRSAHASSAGCWCRLAYRDAPGVRQVGAKLVLIVCVSPIGDADLGGREDGPLELRRSLCL